MDYKVLASHSANSLVVMVKDHIDMGYKPIGGHHVVEKRRQNRYAGTQHKDTVIEVEYSQTIIKE